MAITTNLYPPIMPSTKASFVRTTACKIYFSLSVYNSATDIKNVQVSITNQRTNESAFKPNLYPSGIKIATLSHDSTVQGDYDYYITIEPSDLAGDAFGLNQFYKVQLRFTSTKAPEAPSTGTALATWLYNNLKYFSEWSRVCLIKGIQKPHMVIRGFDDVGGGSEQRILTTEYVDVIGQLVFEGTEENEYLKSYNIKLYHANDPSVVLVDSGQVYTNPYSPNQFNYQLNYNLTDGINYIMTVTYTTNNLYSETVNYRFTMMQYGVDKLNADITATVDNENGRIKVDVIARDSEKFLGNLTIRRTSSQSNFHKWEDVKTVAYTSGAALNYTWYDTTVESGVWYKYCAQKRNKYGERGVIIQVEEPVMCLFDDIFLTRKDCQLKIKFNPSLSEFKYNVTESQQVTLGAKYPFIKRNGSNYYRSFPIGGLITSFIDTTDWYDPHFYDGQFHEGANEIKAFTSKQEIYGDNQYLYDDYNTDHGITPYNDFIYEREFRKKVFDFLYGHNVKLFRSTTEGNILVKLMAVDFQPVESLGRRIYSFTATAVEVDEANIDNYEKYEIQDRGGYQPYIQYNRDTIGQIQGTFGNDANANLVSTVINTKYKNQSIKGFINKVTGLKWLRIEVTSEPYVIVEKNGSLTKATTSDTGINRSNATAGYIVTINGKQMIIKPGMERRTKNPGNYDTNAEIIHLGFFELKEPNTFITELKFKYPTTVTIDYVAAIEEDENQEKIASKIYYYRKVGQLYGHFQPEDSLIRKIYNRYLLEYSTYYQKLIDIIGVRIESKPGAVVYIKDSRDSDLSRHVLENGYLQFIEDGITIEGLYFFGLHLVQCKEPYQRDIVPIRENEYIPVDDERYESFDDIEDPIDHGVYWVSNKRAVMKYESYDKDINLLTMYPDGVFKTAYFDNVFNKVDAADDNYGLYLDWIFEEDKDRYIYYNNEWMHFTKDHDIMCPMDGIVDYYCEVAKGVY